ncbi:MAG: zinc-binding dehydrogenase [Chloroflexi bacterium]|nr:zinc-binding dehydrogenase [Chloroflexota bacterium]
MAGTMRGAIFVGNGKVEVREFPKPEPKGTEVLVQMKASGLCGSDMHSYRNPPEYWAQASIIRGHEPGGAVAEVGDAVTMVKVGDRVSVYHAPSCGYCEACSRGEFFRCTTIGPGFRLASMKVHGSDADYVLVDQNVCFRIPDELSFEDASTIACAGGTAFQALLKADVHAGEYLLVSGLGPVGLCAVQLGKAMGGKVIGVDPIAFRREFSLQHGADYAIDPSAGNMVEQVKAITGEGAEKAIETSGNDRARVDIVWATPYHARIVYVGYGGEAKNFMLSPNLGDRWIVGSNMFTEPQYHELVRFMVRQGVRFSELVTHRFPLEQAQQAFDAFATRETGKVLFVWE